MSRVLVLVGAFLFFRAVLPRASRWSPTAISPYINGLDDMMSAEQASSVRDEVRPFESWPTRRDAHSGRELREDKLPLDAIETGAPVFSGGDPRVSRG